MTKRAWYRSPGFYVHTYQKQSCWKRLVGIIACVTGICMMLDFALQS